MESSDKYKFTTTLQDLAYERNLLKATKLAQFEDVIYPTQSVLVNLEEDDPILNIAPRLGVYRDLNDFHNLEVLNYRLVVFDEVEETSINSNLAQRPWTIILANNSAKLASASTVVSYFPAEEQASYDDLVTAIKQRRENEEINWHEEMNLLIDNWLVNKAAVWVEDFNSSFQSGIESINEFTSAVSKYTKSNIGSKTAGLANSLGGAVNSATAQITQAFNSSNKELADMARGNGAGMLKGSILDSAYLGNIKSNLVDEPSKPTGMAYIGPKIVAGKVSVGSTFYPYTNTDPSTYAHQKINHGSPEGYENVFKTQPIKNGFSEFLEVDGILDNIKKSKGGKVRAGDVTTLDTNENYNASTSADPNGSAGKIEADISNPDTFDNMLSVIYNRMQTDPAMKVNSQVSRAYKAYAQNFSKIPNILRSLDAQLQRYLAYFSVVIDDIDYPLELQTPGSKVDYFYYFYTNGFEFTPVKKAVSSFEYGAFKSGKALEKPEGSNTFSFFVPHDIELSFWNFVKEKGLGVTKTDIYTNTGNDIKINLNLLLLESRESEDLTVDTAKINKFVLENVKFTNLSSLEFNQDFGQMKDASVKGIYKRVRWYHHLPISKLLNPNS